MDFIPSLALLSRGFLLGFILAAPVGPIGVLCVHRTLVNGRLSWFFTGLWAATADVIYASIAAFGLTFISDILISWQNWIRIGGVFFLIYFGLKIYHTPPVHLHGKPHKNLIADYFGTLLMNLAHPFTIIAFATIFSSAAPHVVGHIWLSSVLLVWASLGSIACWSLLSFGASLFRHKSHESSILSKVNKISGIVILVCAVVLIGDILWHLK